MVSIACATALFFRSVSCAGFIESTQEFSDPDFASYSGNRSEIRFRKSDDASGGTPLITMWSGLFTGSGLMMSAYAILRDRISSFNRSIARSESELTASFTCTCRIR